MMWLPEHGVGAVVLTNGDPGWLIRGGFRRKLLEVLFDGNAEADAQLASASETFKAGMAKEFELLAVPASTEHSAALPGTIVMEFVVGEGEEKTLIMRDAQHEYVFDAI
jgi:hypothetical protein